MKEKQRRIKILKKDKEESERKSFGNVSNGKEKPTASIVESTAGCHHPDVNESTHNGTCLKLDVNRFSGWHEDLHGDNSPCYLIVVWYLVTST